MEGLLANTKYFFSITPSSLSVGIIVFLTHHLGLTSMRATASYSYEGLVAAANCCNRLIDGAAGFLSHTAPSFPRHCNIGIIAIFKHIGRA